MENTVSSPVHAPGVVERWRVVVTAGPSRGVEVRVASGLVRIGSADDNQVIVRDRKVSRHHVEVELRADGAQVRDLGSKNGTYFELTRVESLDLPTSGGVITIGDSEIAIRPEPAANEVNDYPGERCGRMLGKSAPMRRLFGQVARLAQTSATVLIQGETGTGKELVAEALHELGPRAQGPFVVVDCGAIPANLIESELFGHVRGAFTGASADRRGALVQADGGTLFLDEIGELDLALQPRLLRVLETGVVRAVGGDESTVVQVRVVAASLRNLAEEVAAGRFREDLYFRLSVVTLQVPPLRDRMEDLPLLVDAFRKELDAPPLRAEAFALLSSYGWPGNVRQLRNVIERVAALSPGSAPLDVRQEDLELPLAMASPAALLSMPYKEAKHALLERFTRQYLESLLLRHAGNVSAAAREARIDRNWIVALAHRYGVRVRD